MLVPNIAKVVHKIITCGKKEKINGTEVTEPPIKKSVLLGVLPSFYFSIHA